MQGDQSDPEFLKALIKKIGKPDIIIDDGSHYNKHVLASFGILFPLLSDNGIYVIEDLYTSYWEKMGGGYSETENLDTSISMLKRLIDSINYKYIPFRKPSELDLNIISVQFFLKIAFVLKGKNEMEDPKHILDDLKIEEGNFSREYIVEA